MEIVSIERKTFEELVAKFDRFVSRMDTICHRQCEKKMSEWMEPNQPQNVLPSRRRAAYRLHRGGQAERSKVQRQDNLTTE